MPTDVDPIIASFEGRLSEANTSYQEIPERDAPELRRLAIAVLAHVERLSPFRRFCTRSLLLADASKLPGWKGGGAPSQADQYTTLAGPSGQITAYWIPADHTAPSVPGDVSWDANVNVTPRELLAITKQTEEQSLGAYQFTDVKDAQPFFNAGAQRVDPVLTKHLAEALVRAENTAFATGAATNADPVRGLANIAGFTTQAASATPSFDDLCDAVTTLLNAKRYPNACFVPVGFWKILRKAKSSGGNYMQAQHERMRIIVDDDYEIPIVPLDGIPNGASTVSYVGDFSQIVMIQRLMANGLLLKCDRAYLGPNEFANDRSTYRVAERFDVGLVPNAGASIVKLTGVNAP